ncbi:Carbonic anhydrase [Nitrospina watsonii]|uniref:carbonic anhydrase n=2 Tax=Nitrospina watsonii TaxID=1323948 RepID=A0ABM9HFZ2_9BACT|nr:Carbonic anhydrase [Nitrospina watsonii]
MRVAGNIINKMILGSLEYTVDHLGTRLILVLGHSGCGAVAAAVSGGHIPGHLASIVHPIQNLVKKFTKNGSPPDVDERVRENVRQTVKNIHASRPILSKMIKDGDLEVAGAIYHLESGKIELL